MPETLPRLRVDLDFMPSPVADRPGLLIRDSLRYSDATLIVPPGLVQCLQLFDGEGTDLDLRQALVQLTGDLRVGDLERHLVESLSNAGFLENEVYTSLKAAKHLAFAQSPVRVASLAGSAYPGEASELSATLREYMDHADPTADSGTLLGIAAPHVSLDGGRDCYRAAYGALGPELKDRTFVILGTSHHGLPERFGLTRKTFSTPLGETASDVALVEELNAKAGAAVVMEDYCHAIEHSIEFQILFLQHLYGPGVRILPILCGPFVRSLYEGGKPEDGPQVKRFLEALGEIAAREGKRLLWVLGIDMAHIGRRYGDSFAAQAQRGVMETVAGRDRARLDRIADADADGFWEEVRRTQDDLRWCGASALYTLMKAAPTARADLLRYEQWNIDEESVVTFAALAFRG